MMNNAIEVRGLVVHRGGKEVLKGLDVTVPEGQVVGLLGPSGCGKTTLMRAIVGVQKVVRGEVTVLGHPAGSRALRRTVAYVMQAPSIYDDLTAEQNLAYFARVLGAPRDQVQRALETVDLAAEARTLAGSLSDGQRNRISLAVALLGSPSLLLLDEPTVGLDPVLRRDLWRLFARLAASGTSLLVSSHVMDEARRCDRLLLMREGDIIADDTPAGLLQRTGAADHEEAFLAIVEGIGARA